MIGSRTDEDEEDHNVAIVLNSLILLLSCAAIPSPFCVTLYPRSGMHSGLTRLARNQAA